MLKRIDGIPLRRLNGIETACLSGMETGRRSVSTAGWRCRGALYYFWVLLMFISMLLRRNMLSSNDVVCSAI